MATIVGVISFFCLGGGFIVLLSNPRRRTNHVFSAISVCVAAWLWCIHHAIVDGARYWTDGTSPLPWLRTAGAISAFFPFLLGLLESTIARAARRRWNLAMYLAVGLVVAWLCFTEWFIPDHSRPGNPIYGTAYPYLCLLAGLGYCHVLGQSFHPIKSQSGLARIESVFLCLNLGLAFLFLLGTSAIGNFFKISSLKHTTFFVFLASYSLAAWAITFHRVYTPRQILLSLAQRIAVMAVCIVSTVGSWGMVQGIVPSPYALLLSFAGGLALGFWLDRHSRGWLDLDGERALTRLRRMVIGIARTEPDPNKLVTGLQGLLLQEYETAAAQFLFSDPEAKGRSELLSADRPAHAALCALGWATPESLEKLRPSPGLDDLRSFLSAHGFGLVVTAPKGSPAPTLLVALAAKQTGWPFTYPEVQRLQSVAELMDNILARSRLVEQAALRAKMDHLAMMSRGLAHDLKNLLTPVSSFLVHTAGTHPPGSVEEEVHAAAQKSVATIADYVREALFFANKLTPQFASVSLGAIGRAAAELAAPRAGRRGIALSTDFDDVQITADAVLLQRLLANVINNAIDAETAGGTVRILGARSRSGWIVLEVTDGGSGIAPENLPRAFDPYFTTKVFGDDVRGFGLGLTICQKIAQLHRGTIRIESQVGAGTKVTVELPVSQPAPTSAPAEVSLAAK